MNQTSIYSGQRSDFTGNTNKYSSSKIGTLMSALNGEGPLNLSSYFSSSDYDEAVNRIERYTEADKFFKGDQWAMPFYKDERKPVYNFCEAIVNKAISFATGKGLLFKLPSGEIEHQQVLDAVWSANGKNKFLDKLFSESILYGDSCVVLRPKVVDDFGFALPAQERGVELVSYHPSYVFPMWDHDSGSKFPSRCLIQYIARNEEGKDFVYSIHIDKDNYVTSHDNNIVETVKNTLGFVPVVFFHSGQTPNSRFGSSDIASVMPLNMSYNSVAWSLERTVLYHAEPTTLLFGARLSTLERGAEKFWSNLPVDARVENLELTGGMELALNQLKNIFETICTLSETPAFLFDPTEMHISNTSGIALRTMCFPILTKTERRRQSFDESFKLLNGAIFKAWEVYTKKKLPKRTLEVEIEYSEILPRDENAEIDAGLKRLEGGIWSQAELIRRLSHVKDFEKLRVELIADKLSKLAMSREKSMALMGEIFTEKSASLDSFSLTGDDPLLGDEASKDE